MRYVEVAELDHSEEGSSGVVEGSEQDYHWVVGKDADLDQVADSEPQAQLRESVETMFLRLGFEVVTFDQKW